MWVLIPSRLEKASLKKMLQGEGWMVLSRYRAEHGSEAIRHWNPRTSIHPSEEKQQRLSGMKWSWGGRSRPLPTGLSRTGSLNEWIRDENKLDTQDSLTINLWLESYLDLGLYMKRLAGLRCLVSESFCWQGWHVTGIRKSRHLEIPTISRVSKTVWGFLNCETICCKVNTHLSSRSLKF